MDEFNKDRNPFNEQNQTPDPYNTQNDRNYDPYNTQQQQQNPYGEQNQGYNAQNVQGGYGQNLNPYNAQQNPYQQTQNPYQQNGGYTYNQQNIPQQGYMNPQGYQPYPRPQSTGMATASLVLGIISICTGILDFIIYPLFLLPIIGIILGVVHKSKHIPAGRGTSTAGIITSVIGLILPILLIVILIMLMPQMLAYIKEMSPEQYQEFYDLYHDQFPQWFEGIKRFFVM